MSPKTSPCRQSPLLQTTNASVSQTITQKQIEDLPVAGRNLLSFASLSAGVTPQAFNRGTQFGAAGSSRSQYVTVEGGRDSSTNYAIDGVYVRSLRFNNLSLNPPLDAVQEVNVLRNSFTTEYGQGQAVVSIVTKSGSNSFTGSAYDYVRDDGFEAANYFGQKPGDRTQAGVTAAVRSMKNRFFVFGGYEGLRATADRTLLGSVPSPTQLAGNFSGLVDADHRSADRPAVSRQRHSVQPLLELRQDAGADGSGAEQRRREQLPGDQAFTDDADTATIRADQVSASKHNLFQRFMYYKGVAAEPERVQLHEPAAERAEFRGRRYVGDLAEVVNETRFGYNYAYHLNSPISLDGRNWVGDIGLRNLAGGTDPIDYGRPGFTMTGFTGNGEGGITQGATENIFSVSNATSWVKGRHNVRFGIQAQFRKFEQLTEVPPRGGFTFNGQFTGNPVADFLLGYCSTCTGAFGSSRSNYSSPTFAPFIDDNWQVSSVADAADGPALGVPRAVARDRTTSKARSTPAQRQDRLSQVVPANLPAQLVPLIINQDDFFPAGILKKDLNNFGPRVGVVYSVNDKTVVRTGFGVYYDNLNLNELQFSRLVPPFYGQYSLQPTPTDLSFNADTLFPDLNNIPQFPAPFSMDPNNRTAYTFQWNGNVQRTLREQLPVVEVAYTGSRSYNEHKRYNINQAQPGTTPIVTRVPYPAFQSAILYSSDAGWARFNGVSFRVEKRYSDGLFFLGNYQLSKSTDNGSGEIEANDTAFAWDLNADEGYARYDQRHRVAFSFGYELPFGPGKRVAVERRRGRLRARRLAGAGHHPAGMRVSVYRHVDQRLPVRIVRAAARQLRGRPRGRRRQHRRTGHCGSTRRRNVPALGTQGTAGRNTVRGPGTSRSISR